MDDRLSSPAVDDSALDDSYMPPVGDDRDDSPGADIADVPMSDPAPSSPAAKVAERKALVKAELVDDEDEDMMEVAHAGAINTASVNIAGSRPPKKLVKPEPYPSPLNTSPAKAAEPAVDSSTWNAITDRLNVVSSSPAEPRTVGKIDHQDAIEPDGSLRMFWTDYTEVNGSLCLFGKVLNKKTGLYVSCFVKVDNILRKLYFLPRQTKTVSGEDTGEEVEMADVYSEVDTIMTKMNIGMYKIKPCTRKYAFELPGIPKEAQYLKCLYPYTSQFCIPVSYASVIEAAANSKQKPSLMLQQLGRPFPTSLAPTRPCSSSSSSGRISWAPAGSRSRMPTLAPLRMPLIANWRFWSIIQKWCLLSATRTALTRLP